MSDTVPHLSAMQSVGPDPGSMEELVSRLHDVYLKNVKPLEDMYKYDVFRPSWYEETILNQKPFVTLFGPWSSGKSSFINYLLQDNYLWTGPQPTTAEFTVVIYGETTGAVDGRVLANAKNLPFKGLNEFGESFMENFQGFQVPHELLKLVTLIDTPGVLESAKDIRERRYDYVKVSRWFAERSDLIFVLFDPTKLDAGTELRLLFKHAFQGMEGKIRILLNKADSVNTQELMRVYGCLFWNLSNLIHSTEPPRVYVGSFWDQPYRAGTFSLLFSDEKTDLLHELMETLPQQVRDKKIASLIRRAKEVLVHAVIVGGMRSNLPMLFGKEKAKRKAIEGLQTTYEVVGSKYKMNWRDFPPVEEYRAFLEKFDLETFPDIEKAERAGLINNIRSCIDTVLPAMLRPIRNIAGADPRNKEHRKELQRAYFDGVRSQYEGKEGKQGSSDVVQTSIRTNAIPRDMMGNSYSPPAQPQSQPQPQPQSQPQPTPMMGMDQTNMMMQMMMQMVQQQQQSQSPQLPFLNQQPEIPIRREEDID